MTLCAPLVSIVAPLAWSAPFGSVFSICSSSMASIYVIPLGSDMSPCSDMPIFAYIYDMYIYGSAILMALLLSLHESALHPLSFMSSSSI